MNHFIGSGSLLERRQRDHTGRLHKKSRIGNQDLGRDIGGPCCVG